MAPSRETFVMISASIAALAVIYMAFIKVSSAPPAETRKPASRPMYIDKNPDLTHSLRPPELPEFDFWGSLAPALVEYAMPNSYGWALDVPKDKKPLDKPARLCIVTVAVGTHSPLNEFSVPNKQEYANKYGFTLHALADKDFKKKENSNPHFYKLDALLMTLERGTCDWAFWMDGDAIFNNDNIRLSDFIVDVPRRVDFVWSWDGDNYKKTKGQKQQSRMYHQFNSGAFFMRNSQWAKDFLNEAKQLSDPKDRKVYTFWNDQGALAETIYNRGAAAASHYLWIHRRAFNKMHGQYSVINPSDFVLHYHGVCRPGQGTAACQRMKDLVDEITRGKKLMKERLGL
eukprot:TRINITY_DN50824_c0_g1_i1.p1 TRINITY_DN50824_c0_g1~~TRINITY_DN50824_c0_g1_i1.p1  ORF type:complete len:344 (+),score=21.27 TRINITY_DN50824_c0_g1_i1:36-1067(+)